MEGEILASKATALRKPKFPFICLGHQNGKKVPKS